MIDLSNKTALITGASRGIGAAAAKKLVGYGANVVLAARSTGAIEALANELNAGGQKALAVVCDVANYADLEKAVALAVETFGSLDILVNNAGLIDPIARLADSDPEDWNQVIDVNVKGVYHGMRAAIPQLKSREAGRSSISAPALRPGRLKAGATTVPPRPPLCH